MKKILLMLVVMVATVSAFAGEKDDDGGGMGKWAKSYAPVADGKDMGAIRLAQGGDGSVYVSSKWNTAFTFGETNVPAPEIATSSAILKYDKDGNERWGIALSGDVEVTCMTADEDGTLYAAGYFSDGVTITGADGTTATIDAQSMTSAFVAKFSADGSVTKTKVFTPAGDPDITTSDFPFYIEDYDPLSIQPMTIKLDGDKLYMSANYKGDVADLGWEGAYWCADYMMYFDNRSYGLCSMNKSDLGGASNVAYVQATGVPDMQTFPEGFGFMVKDGAVGVAFFGNGNLTLTTGSGNTSEWNFNVDGDNVEHGLAMALLAGGYIKPLTFNAASHTYSAGTYSIMDVAVEGDVVYLGGTCYGNFPLDNNVSYDHNYAFITAFDMDQGTMKWTKAFAEADTAVTMLVTGEEIHLASVKGVRTIDPATGTVKADKETGQELNTNLLLSAAAKWEDEYASIAMQDKNYIDVIAMNMGDDEHGGEGGEGGEGGGGMLPGFWENSFEPIPAEQVSDLQGVHVAASLDGGTYVSSTYNKNLSVAGNPLPETEGLVSSMIVRYNNMGQEQWGIAMLGKAEVTAMTTDIDGALYVTGTFQDQVRCIGTGKNNEITITQEDASTISAFVAKVSKDGVFEKVEVFNTAANEEIAYSDFPFYLPDFDYPIHITPNNIQVKDDKVYVSASYQGDVARLGWKGSYNLLDYGDGFTVYTDGLAYGLMQLNKADLSNPVSVAYVKTKDVADGQTSPVACNFLVDHGIFMPFVASGDVTLVTFNGSKDFSFEKDDMGNHEYGVVVAEIGSELKATELHVAKNDLPSPTGYYNILPMVVPNHDGIVYISGTFYGNFWFNPLVSVKQKTPFVVAYDRGSLNWYNVMQGSEDNEAVSLLAGQYKDFEGVVASTASGTKLLNSSNGTFNSGWSTDKVFEFSQIRKAAASYVYLDGNRVYVGGYFDGSEAYNEYETGIESVEAPVKAKTAPVRYNMAGQRVGADYKGIVIVGGKKYLQR